MYVHTHTQTHVYTYTYICKCTYTRIHAHTYTYKCTCTPIHRKEISATTPQRVKQYHRRTYAFIYTCMHVHIYMHIQICAQPAVNVSQMCMLMSKELLYNAYSCTCTGAQTTCSKVHATLTAKKCTYTYTYTHVHEHTYAHDYTCASTTLLKHTEERLLRHKIYAQTCIHIHIHIYIFARVYLYIYACRYVHIYACSYTHIHTHIYAHTYNMYICTHAGTPGTTLLQRLREELMQMPEAPHVSFVHRNQPHVAPSMLWLHCTHFLRHQYPSTLHPLFPAYPRTIHGPRRAQFYCSTLMQQ